MAHFEQTDDKMVEKGTIAHEDEKASTGYANSSSGAECVRPPPARPDLAGSPKSTPRTFASSS